MRRITLVLFSLAFACHREAETTAITLAPTVSASVSVSASPSAPADASTAPTAKTAARADPVVVTEGTPTHFKSGARGVVSGVTFTVRMLPKLMVSGPQPEIEQAQLDLEHGSQRGVIQLDTLHKRAEWGGLVFELGYADVYHDDIEMTVRRK